MSVRKILHSLVFIIVSLALTAVIGCGGGDNRQTAEQAPAAAPKSSVSQGDWIDLSSDPSLSAWTMVSPGAWKVTEGVMEKSDGGGYLWTKDRFGDFVLDCDFKISKDGNSGIFFRTDNTEDPVQTGFEIQVYNIERKPSPVKNDCGALYDLKEPSVYADKPAGEWNHIVITCKESNVTVILNDTEIVNANLDDWDTPGMNPDGTNNKFNRAIRDFKREGHIGFQEHGDPVWFRNVRIKRL